MHLSSFVIMIKGNDLPSFLFLDEEQAIDCANGLVKECWESDVIEVYEMQEGVELTISSEPVHSVKGTRKARTMGEEMADKPLTFEEALKACSGGIMPQVITKEGHEGKVTVIKDHNGHKGVEVVVPALPPGQSVRWYWDNDETDKRKNYMRDLTLKQE